MPPLERMKRARCLPSRRGRDVSLQKLGCSHMACRKHQMSLLVSSTPLTPLHAWQQRPGLQTSCPPCLCHIEPSGTTMFRRSYGHHPQKEKIWCRRYDTAKERWRPDLHTGTIIRYWRCTLPSLSRHCRMPTRTWRISVRILCDWCVSVSQIIPGWQPM